MPLIRKDQTVIVRGLVGFECDRCKKRFGEEDTVEMDEMFYWHHECGYGSAWGDGATVDVTLCQGCAHELFAGLAGGPSTPGEPTLDDAGKDGGHGGN